MLIPTRTLSSLPLSVRLTAIMASVIEGTSIFFQSQITTQKSNLLIIGYIAISIPFILKIKINAVVTGTPAQGFMFTNFQKGSKTAISLLLLKHFLVKLYIEREGTKKAKAAVTEILNSPVKAKSTATNEIMRKMRNIVTLSSTEETQRGTEDFKNQPL